MPPPSLPAIPAAPFADGGEGGYRRLPDLNKDIDVARRALGNERWPIGAQRRAAIVDWLVRILATCEDQRTQVNAAKALLAADKLNLDEARLEIQAELATAKLKEAEKPPASMTVNVAGDVNVANAVFDRIANLERAFAGAADRSGEGVVPGDGTGESVDSRADQARHDTKAG
jgi:hypothetical protein